MNKKLIIGILGAVVAVAALLWIIFGGSKKDDYASVIPEDAVLVARIAPVELLQKNDIELDELADKVGDSKRFVKMCMSYLKGCGIDVTRPFYFFVDGNACLGACFAISNAKDFRSVLKTEMQADVEQEDDYNWVKINHKGYLCFDDEKALFFVDPRSIPVTKSDIIDMMKQDKDKSVMKTKLYQQLVDCNKSLAMNMDYSAMMDIAKAIIDSPEMASVSAVSMLLPDCNLLCTSDIEGSKVTITADLFPNSDKAEKELDEYLGSLPEIKATLTDKGLKTPIAWACINFPGPKILDFVKKIPGSEQVLEEITKQFDLSTMLNSFDGDVTVAINNNFEDPEPEVLMMATTVNNQYVNVLNSFKDKMNGDVALINDGGSNFHITRKTWDYSQVIEANESNLFDDMDDEDDYFDELDELTDDDYGFDEEKIVPQATAVSKTVAYLSNIDNILVISNKQELQNMAGKDSEAMSAYKSDMKGCNFYGVIEFSPIIMQLSKETSNMQQQMIVQSLSKFKNIVTKLKGRHCEISLNTKDDKKVVDVILDLVKNIPGAAVYSR